ncbi:MAG: LTA synthase family protein [Eubacteriales bacterium]|nr:LTA synthase family protein [Eubacteriales bacterium]
MKNRDKERSEKSASLQKRREIRRTGRGGKKAQSIRSYFGGIFHFFQEKSGKKFLVFLECLLAGAFLVQPHLYYDGTVSDFSERFYADSITVCGGLWIILVYLTMANVRPSPWWNRFLSWMAALFTPLLAFFWLELYNHMQFWAPLSEIPPLYLALDLAVYYVIYLFLLLVFNGIRSASVAMLFLTAFFGIMNYELTLFRGMSFIASDIYSFLTAISVANTYQMQVDVDTAEFFMLALVIVALLLKLRGFRLFRWKGRMAFTFVFVAVFGVFYQVYVGSGYLESIGVDFRVYRPQYKYRYYGTLLTTMRTFGYLHVTEPEGYSEEKVRTLTEKYEETSQQMPVFAGNPLLKKQQNPNIIVVMNESFADLQDVGELELTRDAMPFFRSLKENVIKGYTYTSVFGGNTANAEFEFLTGNTMAFLPDNSVPYQLFLREKTAGLTHTLKAQGYDNPLALHPYYRTGYSRYKIYPLMGFERFYTSDDFSVFSDTVNYHITDYEDYKKITELYEASRESGRPFYLFNVTMQNHGSYDGSTFETGNSVRPVGEMAKYRKVTQYLNMIKMSDKALKFLVQYFAKVEEPTVLLFFGDHQPDLDETFYEELLGENIADLEGEELERLYRIPFFIWANYEIEEQNIERTSNNYLATYLADVAGIEKTGYLKFLTRLREEIPCINAIGYWGSDGKFYDKEDKTSPYYEKLKEYEWLEYYNLFGKGQKEDSFFFLEEK